MLRKRIPKKDDGVIFELVETLLLPFAKQTLPQLRIESSTILKRLNQCTTLVDTAAGGKTIGFVSFRPERERLSVDMLAVNPAYQGQGIGTRLMQQAERTASTHGCREVVLWVDDANGQAQRFYMRHGYEPVHYDSRLCCYMLSKRLA